MHTLIFPTKDSYITSQPAYADKNFGLDEIMRVGSYSQYSNVRVYTQTYTYPDNLYFDCLLIDNFTGVVTGSFSGSAYNVSGSILGTGVFTSSYFTGSVSGSVYGTDAGSPVAVDNYSGGLSAFSGSISSSAGGVDGYLTASLFSSYLVTYTGFLSGSSGKLTGYISGSNTVNEQGYEVIENKTISRALLKFNVDAISQSIADGTIVEPRFRLKMKIAKEEELPLEYRIYAFPVSQSWQRGTGYLSDGGATDGVSWNWRNGYSASAWYLPTTSSDYLPTDDYLNNSQSAVMSFGRCGGTWYYKDNLGNNVTCTQSYDYPETSDVYMDVTPIVWAWITGSLPNEGFIVMSSVENATGSNGLLTFFSRDTNTVFSPSLDVMWDDTVWVTGSVDTSSGVTISTVNPYISASVYSGSSLTIGGGVGGTFSASIFLITGVPTGSDWVGVGGFVIGTGQSGNINGMPIVGNITGSLSVSESIVYGSCGSAFTSSFISASFTNGIWSGSSFGAFYFDNKLQNAYLTGSWTEAALIGAKVSIPIPSGMEPYAYAYVTGVYVYGKALGTYLVFDNTSASFDGQFIDGNLIGGYIHMQLTGSVITSSYQYTSSVVYSSSSLEAINPQLPFAAVVQNLRPKYTAGNVVKVSVFGREELPLKNFTRKTQMTQYLNPKYLPSSSYYSIKDNETEEIIIDFDNYTRLSCDTAGNFLMLDTTGFAQERNYRLLLKVDVSGSVYVFDNGDVFKIVR